MAQIHLTTKNEINVIGYILFLIKSQAGMIPGTIVYVNAGTMLGNLNSVGGISSLKFILSFAFIGILPFIAKRFTSFLRQKKVFAGYVKPCSKSL